uniref:Uncharacterized protein n=1 Tax=Tanacetum cinerariifolium TaxID=118510 RepID=A0A6L2LTQ9_TANCI|nr:hypothetical protein [Tanacetum cinerariifolium]
MDRTGGDTFNAINKNGRKKRAEEDFATTAFRAGPLCQTLTKLQLELIHHCYVIRRFILVATFIVEYRSCKT